jgi:hypothetical protein
LFLAFLEMGFNLNDAFFEKFKLVFDFGEVEFRWVLPSGENGKAEVLMDLGENLGYNQRAGLCKKICNHQEGNINVKNHFRRPDRCGSCCA